MSDSPIPASRRILVTGSSGGIGQAIVKRLIQPGDRVGLHFGANRAAAEALCRFVHEHDAEAILLQADLADAAAREAFPAQALEKLGGCDILVNNAGGPVLSRHIGHYTDADVTAIMGLNFTSALLLAQAVLPGMVEQGYGRIISISSIGVKFGGGSDSLVYSAAKSALEIMTMNLAKSAAKSGVLVNAIRAGVTDTPFFQKYPKDLDARAAMIPMGRLARPEEIAEMVAFLVSERAAFITGQTIAVSGGE